MAEYKSIFRNGDRATVAKPGGSAGPRSRGGKRKPKAQAPKMAPATAVSRGGGTRPKQTTSGPRAATPAAAKATVKAPAVQRAKPRMSVQDVKQTIAPMDKTGLSRNKSMQVGGLFGRTASGEWYLGRKKGKG